MSDSVHLRLTRRAFAAGAGAALAAPARAGAPGTLLVSHPACGRHDPGPGHPDSPARYAAVEAALADPVFASLPRATAPRASRDALLQVHSAAHLARLESAVPGDVRTRLSPDVVMSAASLEAALRAAGGAVHAVDAVMRGDAANAFVAARPPGHHAGPESARGFCLVNSAAIAARHAMAAHGAERVAIVDFDVHHGNGTQEIFWSDKNVFYASSHQFPHYPGTGAASETGDYGSIVNAPLAKGADSAAFAEVWRERILGRLDAHRPDMIVISAGFDARLHDPLGGLRLLENDFRKVTLQIMDVAQKRCSGRLVSILEGGYAPAALAACVRVHVESLAGV